MQIEFHSDLEGTVFSFSYGFQEGFLSIRISIDPFSIGNGLFKDFSSFSLFYTCFDVFHVGIFGLNQIAILTLFNDKEFSQAAADLGEMEGNVFHSWLSG